MRLIDAETLNKELNDLPYGIRGIIKTMVHEQPEVDIVECKDCKYSTEQDAYGLRVCRRMCGLSGFTDYDFCSKGERRDDRRNG